MLLFIRVPNFFFIRSIEFDRENEFFATAGVSWRIKVFDFATVCLMPFPISFCLVCCSCFAVPNDCFGDFKHELGSPYTRSGLQC